MSLTEQLAERIAELKAPIATEGPGGPDLSYDPDFEAVKAEIDKLGGLAGDKPSWSMVVNSSEEMLKTRSKDFRLATWWAAGKLQVDGLNGFAMALLFLKEFTNEFWDSMHPSLKRARARGNMTTWLAEQVEQPVRDLKLQTKDKEAIELVNELYGELDSIWSEKLGDAYGGMGGMRGVLRDKVRDVPAEKPAAPPPAAAPAGDGAAPAGGTAAAAAPAAPPAAPSLSSPAEISRTLRSVAGTIRDAARELRKADPAKSFPYRLHRVGIWMEVQATPPAEQGKTRLPPPPPDIKQKLEALMSSESWLDLIEAAESQSTTYLFWLDLQRMTAVAMDRLGALFLGARETLGREVVAFVQLFPALRELKFSDGTPFADPGTNAWLDEELAKWGGGGGGGSAAATAASEEDAQLAERFEKAKEMVAGGDVAQGLALGVALAARSADARTRFRSRLTVARLAVQGGKPDVARPMLEGLVSEIEAHALEEWEPALCASVYATLLSAVAGASAQESAKFSHLFDKLCRLDPGIAIKLAGS